ncbi:MAG: carboxypeptidase-like regulatory domain-containing protein, partial [Candidatus Hydrogenedentes bacterium]|nr:carboxypeptidase-like regulatory domain-containing protein [Candidatus Hydrogenedentota bacterium]
VQRETKTDRDGRFLFQNLPAGSYTVTPMGLTQPTGSLQPIMPLVVNVTEGNVTEASLGAAIGLPVMGIVSNVKPGYATLVRVIRPGAPVPLDLSTAAAQGNADAVNGLVAQGIAGPDGSFQLMGIVPGHYTLEVYALPFNAGNPDLSTISDADRVPKIQQEIAVENQQLVLNLALP